MARRGDDYMHPLSLLPVLHHLLPFMNDKSTHRLAQCSSDCSFSINQIKRHELAHLIREGNKSMAVPFSVRSMDEVNCLDHPETIRISLMIERREKELSIIFPSYVKDFLQICGDLECRGRWDDFYPHPTNMMLPFEEWEFVSTCPIKIPSTKWINQAFEKWRRESLITIGYLQTLKACLLLDSSSGALYYFRFKKFTKLVTFSNWYKTFPSEIGGHLQCRIERFKSIHQSYLTDKSNIIKMLQRRNFHFEFYRYLPNDLKKDSDIVLEVMRSGYVETTIPFKFKDNSEFMLEYISRNVSAFLICSKRLKFDPDFVNRAFEIDFSMYYINDSIKWNSTMKLGFSKANETVESFLNKYVRGRETVQISPNHHKKDESPPPPINGNPIISKYESAFSRVQQNGLFLTYCTDILKSNREIVAAAVENNGMALSFANLQFRHDYEIVKTSLSTNPYSIQLISESFLENNQDILIDYLSKHISNERYKPLIPEKFLSDFTLIRKAIVMNPSNYVHIGDRFSRQLQDKELFILYIWKHPEMIARVMKNYITIDLIDSEIVMAILFSREIAIDNKFVFPKVWCRSLSKTNSSDLYQLSWMFYRKAKISTMHANQKKWRKNFSENSITFQ